MTSAAPALTTGYQSIYSVNFINQISFSHLFWCSFNGCGFISFVCTNKTQWRLQHTVLHTASVFMEFTDTNPATG